jgi:hypothetical protein
MGVRIDAEDAAIIENPSGASASQGRAATDFGFGKTYTISGRSMAILALFYPSKKARRSEPS